VLSAVGASEAITRSPQPPDAGTQPVLSRRTPVGRRRRKAVKRGPLRWLLPRPFLPEKGTPPISARVRQVAAMTPKSAGGITAIIRLDAPGVFRRNYRVSFRT
jgi:hypothetical protein